MTIPRNLSNLAPGASAGGVLSASYGGTGLTTLTAANNALYSTSASALTAGTLPVAAGGTGSTTFTTNNVLLGNGTSALQVVAPGTAGNVLTSNGTTWASSAAPGGGSWIYLSTVTASAAATADIETTFNSTYDNYVIVASNVVISSNTTISMRWKIAGVYSSATRYSYAYQFSSTSPTSGSTGLSNQTEVLIQPRSVNSSSLYTSNYFVYIYNPSLSSVLKTGNIVGQSIENTGPGVINFSNSVLYTEASNVLTGVRFAASSGTISGTFRLYGIKNS
jgi:hypothetical protein